MPDSTTSRLFSPRAVGPYRLPERVGPFRIRAQTGHGGTACTFIGSAPGPRGSERLKCLKIPSPLLLSELSPREVRRIFQNEADVLRLLPPGNIAHLEDAVELSDDEGVMCLVFAYIDGMTLGQLIRKMRAERQLLSWQAVVGVARDLAGALAEAHADCRALATPYRHPPIVHRDVSPANAMIDVRGDAFLIDFGFARAVEASGLYASRAHPGRVAYAAPEYLTDADRGRYGPRLDLFSLGALLFEALTARRAFKGASVESHLRQVQRRERPRVQELRPEFYSSEGPEADLVALVDIVDRLLEPDPDERFQSADAVLSALSSLRGGVDQRPLGARVRLHQSPLEQRVTAGRVDCREVVARVDARRRAVDVGARTPALPDEVLVDAAVADQLAALAAPAPAGVAPRLVARDAPGAPAGIPTTRDALPLVDLPESILARPVTRESGVLEIGERAAAGRAAMEQVETAGAPAAPARVERAAPPLARRHLRLPVLSGLDDQTPSPRRARARRPWLALAAGALAVALCASIGCALAAATLEGLPAGVEPALSRLGALGAVASAVGLLVVASVAGWTAARERGPSSGG